MKIFNTIAIALSILALSVAGFSQRGHGGMGRSGGSSSFSSHSSFGGGGGGYSRPSQSFSSGGMGRSGSVNSAPYRSNSSSFNRPSMSRSGSAYNSSAYRGSTYHSTYHYSVGSRMPSIYVNHYYGGRSYYYGGSPIYWYGGGYYSTYPGGPLVLGSSYMPGYNDAYGYDPTGGNGGNSNYNPNYNGNGYNGPVVVYHSFWSTPFGVLLVILIVVGVVAFIASLFR